MQYWAESKQESGAFTGTTGVKVLSASELSSGAHAWAKRVSRAKIPRVTPPPLIFFSSQKKRKRKKMRIETVSLSISPEAEELRVTAPASHPQLPEERATARDRFSAMSMEGRSRAAEDARVAHFPRRACLANVVPLAYPASSSPRAVAAGKRSWHS